MTRSRRNFLAAAASVVVSAWSAALSAAQSRTPFPSPMPGDPFPRQPMGLPMPRRTRSSSEQMQINQEKIKKNMARLKEAVGELEKEFAENNTTTVLSLAAVRKTEEIEKLARDIRELIRG